MYSVISIDNISREEWGRFVYKHPNGNVFQTPEMYEVYKNTKNYEPVFIGVTDSTGEIVGTLLSVIQREFGGPLGILSSRCVTWGGPLIKDSLLTNEKNEILSLILKKLNDIVKRKALYMEFRNLWDTNDSNRIFENNGYEWEDHLEIIIDLTKGEKELWKEMNKKRRNAIRKAERIGLKIRMAQNLKDVEKIYNIYKDVYAHARHPLPHMSLFLNAYSIFSPKKMIVNMIAEYSGTYIGAITLFAYKKMMYDWYAGAYIKQRNKHPNDILPWMAMKWGIEHGYETFYFGGAGRPNEYYPVRDFKKKFGGVIVNFGRYKNIYHPLLLKSSMAGLKIIGGIKR